MPAIVKPSSLSKVWADTGDKRTPSDLKITTGWVEEIPTFQDFNFLDNRQDQAIAHINQYGVPLWDSGTEYQAGVSKVLGSDGNIYHCKVTNTNNNPTTDTTETNWYSVIVGALKTKPKVSMTPQNGWGNVTGASEALVSNGVLQIYSNISSGTTTDGTVILTLPVNYRPSATKHSNCTVYNGSVYSVALISIATNGDISINGVSSSNSLYISASVVL